MVWLLAGIGLLFLCGGHSHSVAEDEGDREEVWLQEQRSSDECSQR